MKNHIFTIIAICSVIVTFAQEKVKDTLTTDEIHVVKPYTPTVADAFKAKENPSIEKENITKDSVDYNYFAVPVASTFTPTKGEAKSVVREPLDYVYENYVSAGFGNYTTPFLEALINTSTTNTNNLGIFVRHISSNGDIPNTLVDDNYSNSRAKIYYRQQERDFSWEAFFGGKYQIYNWYGLPQDINYDPTFINSLNSQQKYININGGANIEFNEGIFRSTDLKIDQFSDDYNSSEIQIALTPEILFPVNEYMINVPFHVNYINGTFDENYFTTDEVNYGYLNLGVSPSFDMEIDEFKLNLGIRAYYGIDSENDENEFYLYPNFLATYNLIEDKIVAFAGIVGDLTQNSFRNYTEENPFISPTSPIQQTDQQFNTYIGAKGKLLNSKFNYSAKISYQNEKDRGLFILNPTKTDGITAVNKGYEAGNSFAIIYDNVDRFQFFLEGEYQISTPFSVGGNFEFNNYETEFGTQAWNLPSIKGSLFGNYTVKKWFAGAHLYFVGDRYDYSVPFGNTTGTEIQLDAYIDVNANAGYIFNDRLTGFIKANNILGTNYERYANFEVQGFQILAGATYKFDL